VVCGVVVVSEVVGVLVVSVTGGIVDVVSVVEGVVVLVSVVLGVVVS
jgi:hypothetical protein